ncbi:MAG: peptide deformylase [Bacteroidota bacterium]
MILPVVAYGNPVLKKKAVEIDSNYPDLQKLIADMFDTMYTAAGVGLAAPQVGHSIRLFVIDATPFAEDDPKADGFRKVFINAEIVERSGEETMFEEGCLSFPGIHEEIFRPSTIRIKYFDEKFQAYDEVYDHLIARIIQHEYDHIEGILMTDHMSNLKKVMMKRKLKELTMGMVTVKYKMLFPSLKK